MQLGANVRPLLDRDEDNDEFSRNVFEIVQEVRHRVDHL
jgi:hypothetical protein